LKLALWNSLLTSLVTNLGYRTSKDGQIDLQGLNARTFSVNRLSVKRCQLNSWNLCAIGAKAPGAESLNCTYLTLKFEDMKKLEEFEVKLLRLQALWCKLELNIQRRLKEIWTTSIKPIRTADLPSTPTSTLSPIGTSLPTLPNFELLGEELLPELEIERLTRELDGSPVVARSS
jgi:hypothetical protein